jgi:hypothetical protein
MFSDPDQILSNQRFKGNSTPEKDAQAFEGLPSPRAIVEICEAIPPVNDVSSDPSIAWFVM